MAKGRGKPKSKNKSSVRLRRPGSGGKPGARPLRKTPGGGTGRHRRTSDPARAVSAASATGIVPAQRVASGRTGGSVAGRRVQGLGLAIKMSLAIALLVAAVTVGWGFYQAGELRKHLENTIKRNGAQAALILTEPGRRDVAKYLKWKKDNKENKWTPIKIDKVLELKDKRTGGIVSNDSGIVVEDAVILYGSLLISSARDNPRSLKGEPEDIDGKYYANVECLRGTYERREGNQTRSIKALQFKATFAVPEAVNECSARLVVAINKVDKQVSDLISSALVAGVIFVLIGVGVSYFLSAGIVRPVRRLMRDMDVVSRGDFNHVTKRTSGDEIGLLAMAFNDMTKSLKVAQELEVESEKVQAELDTAREIQAHLLPSKIPQLPGFDIYQAYSPARQVSGDYFDFIPVDRENLGVVCADVSGKGIPGMMVMGSTRTVLRMLAAGNPSAADALAQTNAIVARDIKRGMFVTAIYGVLNVRQKTMTVASAGHNPMVLFRARTGKCELINPAGIALGFDKGPIFNRTVKEQKLQLYKGDRVVLYTDGVVEAMNENHEEFGDERFYKWVQANARIKSRDFVRALLRELDEHRGNAEQHDDITIVTVRVE